MPSITRPAAGLLQVCAAGVLWGTGGLFVQLVRRQAPLPVLTISAYRMLIAAAVLLAAIVVRGRWRRLCALLRARPVAVLATGAGTAAYQGLYFVAVVDAGVSVATVVALGLAPVILTANDAIAARRRPSAGRIQVVVLGVAGLGLVSAYGADRAPRPALGVLAAITAGVVYALTTAISRPVAQLGEPLLLTTASTAVGSLVLVPLALIVGGARGMDVPARAACLADLAYLGLVTMALAYALLYMGLRTVPESSAVIVTLLEPVTAAVAAAAVLGERMGVRGTVGATMILASVLLLWLHERGASEPTGSA